MDAAVGRKPIVQRELAAVVRASAEAAERLVEVLGDAAGGAATPGAGFGHAVKAGVEEWPVEGGSVEEAVKSAALLLVLRELAGRCLGEEQASWKWLERGGDGAKCLTDLGRTAERVAGVDAILRRLNDGWPRDLSPILAAAADELEATLPLAVAYERLLARFDRRQRTARGVFHTPRPVVRWMTGAVEWLVKREFPAAERLRLVDMGCGCGSFLAEFGGLYGGGEAADARTASLLGYEVLPSAYAMASWLLAHCVDGGGCDVELRWVNPLLRGEAEREGILRSGSLPILVGNPPYANFGRGNRGPWIGELLRDYKHRLGERKTNLDDDFIKFIRWGQHWIDQAGAGILAVVTSSTYLDGITHRQMRESLLESFQQVYLLNLGGDVGGALGQGAEDENVFGVRSGVAVGIFVKRDAARRRSVVKYCGIHGSRLEKFSWLEDTPAQDVAWRDVRCEPPRFSFLASDRRRLDPAGGYAEYWPLTRIFRRWISGVQTKHDALFVDFDPGALAERMEQWLSDARAREEVAGQIEFDWRLIQPYLVAPFDRRWIYYDPRLLGRARYDVMRHMLQPNTGLVFMRQSTNAGEYDHFLAVDCLVSDRVFYSRHGAPYLAPLWLYSDKLTSDSRAANFSDAWLAAIRGRVDVEADAQSLFDYIYASIYRTAYREQFAAELRRDFPRVPLPAGGDQFLALAAIGQRLRTLHTSMELAAGTPDDLDKVPTFIGGYDVVQRWRKPRRGREPLAGELEYEQRLRCVLAETRRLRTELDQISAEEAQS